jgi:hypothetical protein
MFRAEINPSNDSLTKVAELEPTNPFYTSGYCAAMRDLGNEPVAISFVAEELNVGCTGFIRSGRVNRSLEITSIPPIPADSEFWTGLECFCRQEKISILNIDSFASQRTDIPSLSREISRRARVEFILRLNDHDLWKKTRKGHRWSINRGRKAGLALVIRNEPGESRVHAAMFEASMQRRKKRGENTPDVLDVDTCDALIRHEAGKLFQVVLDGRVMSSALVLMSATGAYYQTSGTSSEGMERGASHFLIFEIAKTLQEQGLTLFNLGGTDKKAFGLQEFKTGFGTDKVELEEA